MFTLTQTFDDFIGMPDVTSTHDDILSVTSSIMVTYKYWADMIGEEFPADAQVRLNVVPGPVGDVYFLSVIMPDGYHLFTPGDYPKYQVDTFTIVKEA